MKYFAAFLAALLSFVLVSCSVKYHLVGTFDNYNQVFIGNIDSNLLAGTAHIVVSAKDTGVTCEGDSHITYVPPSLGCAGERGVARLFCSDGRIVDSHFVTTSCTSGYGQGVDNNGAVFHFVFGLNNEDAQRELAKLKQSVSNNPKMPVYRPKEQREQKGFATGTGFFVTNNGVLVTNYHVIDGAKEISIVFPSEKREYQARIFAVDAVNDVAILKINAKTDPAPLASSCDASKGSEVLTLGYPLITLEGQEQKATFGRVNALSGPKDDLRLIQIDVPIQPGNSGGPLINRRGNVVGVVSATLNQLVALRQSGSLPQNVNFAVKIDYILPALRTALRDKMPQNIPETTNKTNLSMVKIVAKRQSSVVLVVAK